MYTPGFAAPEMYRRDGTLGPWTDIYAIGACIYACMQGYPPNDAPQRIEKDRLALALSRLRNVYSRQPDRGDRVVHVARSAVAPAERVRAAEGAVARDRAAATPSSASARGCACSSTTWLADIEKTMSAPRASAPPRPSDAPPMRFSVYQISRKGGREKNEDRMGYCYTRESGLFVLADGMGGHPEGEVAVAARAADARRDVPERMQADVPDPLRSCTTPSWPAHHQIIRYASEKALLDTPRTTLVACLVQGNAGLLGALRRFAPVRRARRQAARAHARPLVLRAAADDEPGRADGRPLQPQHPVHLPGHRRASRCSTPSGPCCCSSGDRILLCSDGLWGTRERQRHRRPAGDAADLRRPCPSWSSRRCATAARTVRQRHGDRDRVGDAPTRSSPRTACPTDSLSDGVFASTIQAGVLGTDGRRARRRRDRALDRRDQRSDPALAQPRKR